MRNPGELPRQVDQPEPGYFELQLVRRGPLVPARIERDRDGLWQAWIDGVASTPPHHDPVLAADVFRIWLGAQRISAQLYEYRLATAAWARANEPDHPAAHPCKPIDLRLHGSLF